MVIPVKVEHKHRVPGFIHSASSSGATVFIEPAETLELNNEIRSLQFLEQREMERILRALTAQVGTQRDTLLLSLDLLADLDCLQARARYSLECLGMEPEVGESGPLILEQARHPLLLGLHGRAATVPLDVSLGEHASTLVISGPNAGGKSVALKCVGMLVAMAQAGLHIPASPGSRIRIVRSMFVDIGDDQSIESDLSTFSSHLRNLKEIAEQADEHTLVLIDEIGTGTDPAEGGAIAAALLELLTRRGALTVATTHHSALKVFAHETPGVVNGAMEFDRTTLQPTYRFRPGVPGSSYALEMAARLGFPPALMEKARSVLGSEQSRLEQLLVELEAATQEHRAAMDGLRREQSRVDTLISSYEEKMRTVGREVRDIKQRAAEEARLLLGRVNAEIEQSVREIRESAADAAVVKEARQRVDSVRKAVAAQEEAFPSEDSKPGSPPSVGSTVRLAGGEEAGEVLEISGDSAVVVFGSLKIRVPVANLYLTSPRRAARLHETPLPETPSTAERDLDLRGMTGDEAMPLIDKFIDSAILAGLHRVDIIHGKGTGALRKKVTQYLSHHPRVKSFRLGEWNEGGTGATVVELGDT
jgi:DNA mismatch repair protein MutS2